MSQSAVITTPVQTSNDYLILNNKKHGFTHENADYLQTVTTNPTVNVSFRVIGNYPRSTPITHRHTALNLEPIHQFIYRLTDKYFYSCPAHPNPPVREIVNYTLPDLDRLYRKYTGCPRRNRPNFGRVFLMLNYTDITQNTYVPS